MTAPGQLLETLERLALEKRTVEAFDAGFAILQVIDQQSGRIDGLAPSSPRAGSDGGDVRLFCTRFADAFGHALVAPDLELSPLQFERLLLMHRWVDLVFDLSRFEGSDYFLRQLMGGRWDGPAALPQSSLFKFLALRSLKSELDLDLDELWRASPGAATVALLHYTTTRDVYHPRAFEFRERILEWLPAHLTQVELGRMTLQRIPEFYMHCSYARTPRKHVIKGPLIAQMRRTCLASGATESMPALVSSAPTDGKPTIVIVGEYLTPGHSVFRTHSRAVASLRSRFRVIGLAFPDPTGTTIEGLFDEYIRLPPAPLFERIRLLANEILIRRPALIFYLGVGMVAEVIGLASLRLAPVQCTSFGHTATTFSPSIDYFILPDDFVGSPAAFSEELVALAKEAMPMVVTDTLPKFERTPLDGCIRIAIPASTMKLNPVLFEVIARIGKSCRARTEFHFFALGAKGLSHAQLTQEIRKVIPDSVVHPEIAHDRYMSLLSQCDLYLCPFPYGNMNSIIDCFRLGLAGVCLDGSEAHAHADAALFRRIGMPPELTATSVEQYVQSAVRLIEDGQWREQCRGIVRNADLEDAFFAGDDSLFPAAIEFLLSRRQDTANVENIDSMKR